MKIRKKNIVPISILILVVFLIFHFLFVSRTSKTTSTFDKSLHPTDISDSLWAVVNKGRKLPSGYVPTGLSAPAVNLRLPPSDPEMELRPDSSAALVQLVVAAKKENLQLMLASGYRSYEAQEAVFAFEVASNGESQADKESARPGYSEHQTGLAADLEPVNRNCEIQLCFADTPEGKWLANNSYKYGFIIRYQKGHEGLTGYQYEPWHIRFVGKDLAYQLYKSNQTPEQFFNQPSYSSYSPDPLLLK